MSQADEHCPVSVCVCTRRRPESLKSLLERLSHIERPGGELQIVVVENDYPPAAREIVESATLESPDVRVDYAVEPRQNIALARNLAVSLATGEWIAFIDDDETPVGSWVVDLLKTARCYNASGVFGPVVPVYPSALSRWAREVRLYDRPRFPTGAVVPLGELRTGNALISRESMSRIDGPFDPRFGLTGGEDVNLFSMMAERGGKFVWCDTAYVSEVIEPRRLTLREFAKRAFAGGQTYARIRWGRDGLVSKLALVGRGLAGIFLGASVGTMLLPFRRGAALRWLLRAVGGVGKLSILLPLQYRRYQ